MMAVIMQKCDDTHNVATDDRTTLPSEGGAVLFLFAYLNRILDLLSIYVTNVCVCLNLIIRVYHAGLMTAPCKQI